MGLLILGSIVFFGVHLLPAFPDLRGRLVARLGEGPYKGLFAVVSIVGLVALIVGFRQAPFLPVWDPPAWTRHLALLLMLPAAILMVAAYVPGRIKARLRHPFLAAVKLWALGHLLANGDLASLILFGSFFAYAVYDRIALKGRQAHGLVRVETEGPIRNDLVAVGAGVVLYAAIALWLHPLLGPAVLP